MITTTQPSTVFLCLAVKVQVSLQEVVLFVSVHTLVRALLQQETRSSDPRLTWLHIRVLNWLPGFDQSHTT